MKSRWLFLIGIMILAMNQVPAFAEDYAEFRSEELRCVIGNNASMGEHREGYNGVFNLTSIHQAETLFVPAYAGLNLEHYFDGSDAGKDRKILFEPRVSPMEFRKIDDRTAMLHQPPTPYWNVESTTSFQLKDPYYIDVTFKCVPRKKRFQGGAMGVFWASYINEPSDKSIYFLRRGATLDHPLWQQFCTQYHDRDSTVKHEADPFEWTFVPTAPKSLFSNISAVTYAEPFYFGRRENMVWIVLFEKSEGIRFAHSPSGGGHNRAGDDTCPAWDFQFIVPDYQVGKEYTMEYRVAYKPWVDRADVLNEARRYFQRRE